MMRIRTARERVLLGILVLLVLLGGVIALASWRARSDGHERLDLTRRASVVAALQDARAQFLRGADLVATAVFVQDPAPVIDSYRQAMAVGDEALNQARTQLAQIGDPDTISALETFSLSLSSLRQDVEPMLASAISVDREARLQAIQEYPPKLWPRLDQLLADLDGLAIEQQAKLTTEQSDANHASDVTLALLISSNVFAFVAGSAVLVFVFVWVIRPLSTLRSSVKAIAAGDFQASAKVSGPEEIASLARDFNEMVARRGSMEEALRDSDERYRTLFNHSLDAVYVHDFEGRFVDANDSALQLLGYSREEISNLSFTDLLDDSQLTTALAAIDELMRTGRQTRPNTFRLRRKDGAFVEMEVVAAVVQREGRPAVIQGIARDITKRKQAEEALRESEAKYRRIFETVQDIFYHTDARGIITEISPSVGRWGYTREELIGTQVLDVYENPEERSALLKTLMERGEVTDYEVHLRAADGEIVNASVGSHILRDSDGTVVGVEGFLRDIRERKKAEEALREQMRRDPLTGVLNHAAIVNELRSLIPTDGGGSSCAVLMSDVDDLKAINDTFGHQVGDSVLMTVADTLCRDGAVVGRYGGDEFVAILPGAGREAAERYRGDALNALEQVAMRDPQSGTRVPVVVSIGLAIYPIESGRIEELIDLADSGMYGAKRQRPVGATSVIRPEAPGSDRTAKIVGEIVPFLTSTGDLNEKLSLVARRLSVAAGYDAVSFSLFKQAPNVTPSMSTFGQLPEKLVTAWHEEQPRWGQNPHPIRQLVEQGRPIIFTDPQHDERLTTIERELLCAGGLRSALAAPMIWRNEMIGMLSVASKRENAFSPRDAQFLSAIATQVTAIVSMETLVKKLQSASGRLAQAHTETVMLLAAAAEAHDRTTGQHLRNVRTISEELAQELGWREEDAKELGLAAVLHDIGKIRVADSVLANTGRLTNEEWELMKHHATWGEEFLAGRPGFELAAVIARSHHERWDGVGYPDGLSGEETPEAAAIVAVADSFDAMTSGRPYKPGRPAAAAMNEIVACSGSQFSPRVVEAMVHLRKRRRLPHLRQRTLEEKAA
jgi:diguanylate cyclase (GGDEF)-like protein/PAS domain S-box-containing protein